MDKNAIKKFAVWARTELIARVSLKGVEYGITEDNIEAANADSVGGKVLTADEKKHIAKLLEKKHYDPDNCDEKEFHRIYQFLMRRGFKSSQILSAMRSQLP